eukprot:5683504-Amphidinium_carterae.1
MPIHNALAAITAIVMFWKSRLLAIACRRMLKQPSSWPKGKTISLQKQSSIEVIGGRRVVSRALLVAKCPSKTACAC